MVFIIASLFNISFKEVLAFIPELLLHGFKCVTAIGRVVEA